MTHYPKVLVISSADPTKGPGVVAINHYMLLRKNGIEVDFLTTYPVESHPEFISVYKKPRHKRNLIVKTLDFLYNRRRNVFLKNQQTGYGVFYQKETQPPVRIKWILKKITKQYDIVSIFFWQGLLSFSTVEAIYDRLKCQIHFRCVDYSVMAGGCHFTSDCIRYYGKCGKCPAMNSNEENDFSHFNVLFRERFYKKVKPVVFVNTYMKLFFQKSYLFRNYNRIEISLSSTDIYNFRPLDMANCRKLFNVPPHKKFLIFYGCQYLADERKGIKQLIEALNIFHKSVQPECREEILLVLAGKGIDEIKASLPFDYLYLGYVAKEHLSEVYSMVNLYICPSINDAGPTMVGQSISCGTPVVAFEMGAALDLVKDKGTGYCAKLCNSEDLANGILKIYSLPDKEYELLRIKCREFAVEMSSEKLFIDKYLKIFHKYQSSN